MERPLTTFNLNIGDFLNERLGNTTTVLCGSNNSGKSYLLQTLHSRLGHKSFYLAPGRYYNISQLSNRIVIPNENQNYFNNFQGNFSTQSQNFDSNYKDFNTAFTGLSTETRRKVLDLSSELIGAKFDVKSMDENNDLSPKYIDVDGYNLSFTSTGSRLVLELLTFLADSNYENVLVDEPEMGLNPKIQMRVSNFLYDLKKRSEYFPHIKHLFVSTHSHLFLDRNNFNNNFSVTKIGNQINIEQILTIADFHNLQFSLLGNSFESLFLPSLMVMVEGPSDFKFLKKVLETKFPELKIAIIQTNGDTYLKERLNSLKETLDDFEKSPYKDRILVILDEKHSASLPTELERMGLNRTNIILWDKNGIEYYYPENILKSIFSCDDPINKMKIDDSKVEINGITKTKTELSDLVSGEIDKTTEYNEELNSKLLAYLARIIS